METISNSKDICNIQPESRPANKAISLRFFCNENNPPASIFFCHDRQVEPSTKHKSRCLLSSPREASAIQAENSILMTSVGCLQTLKSSWDSGWFLTLRFYWQQTKLLIILATGSVDQHRHFCCRYLFKEWLIWIQKGATEFSHRDEWRELVKLGR